MGVLSFASLKPDVPKRRSNPQYLWAGHLLPETGFLGGGQLRWMGCVLQHDGGMDVCPTAKEHRRRCCARHGERGGLLPQEGAGGMGPRSLLSPWRGVIASLSWHTDLAGLAWEGHPHRGPHPWIACELRAPQSVTLKFLIVDLILWTVLSRNTKPFSLCSSHGV